MGKLNIAHHKSYHPYRLDNIEKVKRDEEEARKKEEREDGRMMLADSEARLDLLRERAGTSSKRKPKKDEDDMATLERATTREPSSSTGSTARHINLFEDLEQHSIASAVIKVKDDRPKFKFPNAKEPSGETEKGFPLAPSAKDLKPWYSARTSEREKEPVEDEDRKTRELSRKSMSDPLTSINQQLASRPSSSSSSHPRWNPNPVRPPPQIDPSNSTSTANEVQARLTRESSERQRALELIARKKRELAGSATPSTVHGGDERGGGYSDVFNRVETEEAHAHTRQWGRDRYRTRRGDLRDRRW